MSEDADALFLGLPEPGGGVVRPMLAFESPGFMTLFMPGAKEATDPRISSFLSGGFGLLSGEGWLFPLLEEWHIDIDEAGDLFALVDPNGFPAYSVALTEVTPSWLADVKREGKCLVLTGTGLGLDIDTFNFERVSDAAAQGNVVGALVPVHGFREDSAGSRITRWLRRRQK